MDLELCAGWLGCRRGQERVRQSPLHEVQPELRNKARTGMVARISANAWEIAAGLSSELTERKEAVKDTSRMECVESSSWWGQFGSIGFDMVTVPLTRSCVPGSRVLQRMRSSFLFPESPRPHGKRTGLKQ